MNFRDDVAIPSSTAGEPDPVQSPCRCGECGQPARVCVLQGYRKGEPVCEYYCLDCRVPSELDRPVRQRSSGRLSGPLLICLVGLVIGILGGAADLVVSDAHPGFGWYQRSGLIVGAIIVFLGMLLRAEVVALGGVLVFGGALSWDWFGYSEAPGIGWKQQAALIASALLLILAVVMGLRSRQRFAKARRKPVRVE